MHPSHTPFLHENNNFTTTINSIINFPSNPYDTQHEDEEALFLQNFHFLLQDHEQQPQLPFPTNDINLVPKTPSSTTTTVTTTNKKMGGDEKCSKKIVEEDQDQDLPSKLVKKRGSRSCRKDRHSKINTAKGSRDRRVRLSVEVARRFFDLQDLLGFDKPSEIVQWLLTNSKSAIKQLKNSSNSSTTETKCGTTSSDQYCEVLSGIDESPLATLMRSTCSSSSSRKEKMIKKISSTSGAFRKITSALIKRESREKARERARERTKEKKNIHKGTIDNGDHLKLLLTSSRQGIIDMDMDMDVHNFSQLGFLLESSTGEDQEGEEDIFGDSNLLSRSNNWTHYSTSSFIHQHNPAISHEQEEQHQLTDDFEVYGNSTYLSQRALYPRSLV